MKTRVALFLFVLQMIAISGYASGNRIDGNGHIVTREFPISDYDGISFVGWGDFEYEQSNKAPFLSITIDENLLEYLDVKVEGKTLKIEPKKSTSMLSRNSYNLNPTSFKIRSNSRKLQELNVVGSGDFTMNKPIAIEQLEINKAGSGNILFNGKMTGRKLECKVAGSGTIVVADLHLESLKCSLAGSGEARVKGKVDRAEYSVAGSGKLDAYDCIARKADCSTAGSGRIHAYAEEYLEASIAGSGQVYYKGNPEVSKSIMGSGSVRKANESNF